MAQVYEDTEVWWTRKSMFYHPLGSCERFLVEKEGLGTLASLFLATDVVRKHKAILCPRCRYVMKDIPEGRGHPGKKVICDVYR